MSNFEIREFLEKKAVSTDTLVFTGAIENPWEVQVDIEEVKNSIQIDYFRQTPPSTGKYLSFMPIKNRSSFVSLQEGSTPLLRSKRLGSQLGVDLYFKVESQNPTGSFKDRGSALELSVALEHGAKGICVASTGNMAASCACYAAAAKLPCFVFVPEGTPVSKLAQTISYGGHIVQVKGTYNDAACLAESIALELGLYLAGDYAFRIEGAKTAGFELIDQLFYREPDAVVVPMGCGTNLASYYKAFFEYKTLGLINNIPQIIGAQAEGAKSIVNAFKNESKKVTPLTELNTVASAISVLYPLDGVKALHSIYSSNGFADSVSESEILESQYLLAKEEGLFVEASSATALSLIRNQKQLQGKTVVCVLTGDGLKDTSPVLRSAITPPTIKPDVSSFLNLYRQDFFQNKTMSFVPIDTKLFTELPTKSTAKKVIHEVLEQELTDSQLDQCHNLIQSFIYKGKIITLSDLRDIVQAATKSVPFAPAHTIEVKDFSVTTKKNQSPLASVEVEMDNVIYNAQADGVGPVDAVICALKKACGSGIEFALDNYQVAIRSKGTDAVVVADVSLSRSGKISIGQGTSPDVIEASIIAFEHAYNGL